MCRKVCLIGLVALLLWGFGLPIMAASAEGEKITINLASRILTFYQNGIKKYMYHIGAGRADTPTPTGSFFILSKEEDPEWVDPKDSKIRIESGEDNPLGYRWMEFKDGFYGIHGTNRPESIGGYVSNGCVRMHEEDVEQLYDEVEIGIPVEIRYERIVIEQAPDGVMVYYIYPDGYGWQYLEVEDVREQLEKYAFDVFLSDAEIQEKIDLSDGEPTYLGRVYRVFVDDRWISGRALERDGVIYLPAQSISMATKVNMNWNQGAQKVLTAYGEARGYVLGGKIFVGAADLEKLFGLQWTVNRPAKILNLTTSLPLPGRQEKSSNTQKVPGASEERHRWSAAAEQKEGNR